MSIPENREFFRTSDTTYLGEISNPKNSEKMEVSVQFKSYLDRRIGPEQRRDIVTQVFNQMKDSDKDKICSGEKDVYFRANGKVYYLTPKSHLFTRSVARVFRFLKLIKNPSKVEYKIKPSRTLNIFFRRPLLTIFSEKPPRLIIDDLAGVLRETTAYNDPFTELSTRLFQDFEPFHEWRDVKDEQNRDASQYQLVILGDSLAAVTRDVKKVTREQVQDTIKAYKKFVVDEFGQEVLDRIQTTYEFSLDTITALTPEIVYRINVGTSHIETSDVTMLADALHNNKPLPNRLERKVDRTTMQNLDPKKPEDFATLMKILSHSEKDHEAIFTGRKLHGKISSWYTQGDEGRFKPWADQQEFTQTCFKIPERDWKCFYEDLAMILCKKHLHQKNLDGTYRLGALIPAPRDGHNPQEYYKVTSWIHNSRGIFSYTLEPACPNSHLQVIKLYRSTSVSAYNLDGAASYKNDFNPINPPGYEGSHLLEQYEMPFFQERTIPVWVGYQHAAEINLVPGSLWAAKNALLSANNELILDIKSTYIKPTLKQFIRTHDSEFMDLIADARKNRLIGTYSSWYLLNNSLRNTVRYDYSESSKEVRHLKQFLELAATHPNTQKQAQKLLEVWNQPQRAPSAADNEFIQQLKSFEDQSASCPPSEQQQVLTDWNNFLHSHAVSLGENVEAKKAQSVDFVGHSLGAACAQRFLVAYTTDKRRIPLPNQQIAARLFDDPAIIQDDNDAFIQFGNKHGDLMASLKAKFAIVRRQEAGDPVPSSGDVHLGATKTSQEQARTYKWLQFDAAVQKASSKAIDPQVRDYTTAHGRLYAGAKVKKGKWYKNMVKEAQITLQMTHPDDKVQLEDLEKRQKAAQRGDYKITHYDSTTQYQFDMPKDKEAWEHLSEIWDMPFRFTPIYAERLRTYMSAAFRSGFFNSVVPAIIAQLAHDNPEDDIAHGDWKKHRKEDGVFVVKDTPVDK
ncbi:MAG: hypothetical protein LLF94_01355 [Chlamydiales bacterium]|nr:hypothetical protein [Chlamydiales bacterium]